MKKILLLILATSILFSMSGIFVYADFAAGATVQSYDFENMEAGQRTFTKEQGYTYSATNNTYKNNSNNSNIIYKIGNNGYSESYIRQTLDTAYVYSSSVTDKHLFELNFQLLLDTISSVGSIELGLSGSETYATANMGTLVITYDQIKWLPTGDSTYTFTADISEDFIATKKWMNIKLVGDMISSNNTSRIAVIIDNSLLSFTASNNITATDGTQYTTGNSYSVLPMKYTKANRHFKSFEIAVDDTSMETIIFVDNISTAVGDGSVKLKDIEAQTLDINEVKSIDLNDYFLAYDGSEITYSIDEEFGTIENGVLTFNTSSAVSETVTLTAGNKSTEFDYTVKADITIVNVTSSDNVFSSNEGENITVDSKTYERYIIQIAKVNLNVPGYTLSEYGMLIAENSVNSNPRVTSQDAIKGVAKKDKTTDEGAYGILFEGTGIKAGVEYCIRPYATYIDSEGNKTHKYGSTRTITLNN